MRWRRHVTAESLPELRAAAERYFPPGTTFSIYSVRDETPGGVFISYRAEAHPPGAPGKYSTSRRISRPGSRDGAEAALGAAGWQSGVPGPDGGPVTGRILEPGAGGPVGGRAHGVAGGPAGGLVAGPGVPGPGVHVPGGGVVAGYNPETVDEIPGWRPEGIPARVLADGPGLNAAYALLQDPGLDVSPDASSGVSPDLPLALPLGPAFATDDPEFVSLLDRAAPPEEPLTGQPGPRDPDRTPVDSTVASPGGSPIGSPVGPPDSADDDDSGRAQTSARTTVVYVGLLDDPVEAAEKSGHRRWSAAGVLNGGQPGAHVVCYGLGDGSNITRLAEGLHRYQPMRLVLAVDPSRKHADTQAWVRQVAAVVQPSSLVSVARTLTSTPGTVQELGYPVQYLG